MANKDQIIVIEPSSDYSDDWRLAWFFAEEGDIGAIIGDHSYSESVLESRMKEAIEKENDSEYEFFLVEITAMRLAEGSANKDSMGYYWPTKAAAKKALAAINLALKNKSEKPWPTWALKAKAAGWTPPENWKP